jgi:hypothetical protein
MDSYGGRFIYCSPFQSNLVCGILDCGHLWNIYNDELYGLFNEPGISKFTQ